MTESSVGTQEVSSYDLAQDDGDEDEQERAQRVADQEEGGQQHQHNTGG